MRLKKLFPLALLAINASLVASIGLTVAWYANGAYLRISDVDVSLISDPNLGLSLSYSVDKEDYHFGKFPHDELPKMKSGYSDEYSEDSDSVINGFVPVSSMYSDDWIGQTDSDGYLLDPIFCQNYKRASIFNKNSYLKTDAAISGFYSIPLYMYCDVDMYATIDSTGTLFTADEDTNKAAAEKACAINKDLNYDEYKSGLDNIVNSMRFSIYDCESRKYWIIDPNKGETTTYFAGTLDLDANKTFDYYSDGKDSSYKEYLFGEYQNPENVVYKTTEDTTIPEIYDTFNAKHAEGVEVVDVDYYIDNNLFKVEESYTPEQLSKKDLIQLKNHVPHRIVLSIYIEGWDRDNTQISSLGAFFASIKFKLTKPYFPD